MDKDILEYLSGTKPNRCVVEENHAVLYERRVSMYCSSTVMAQVTWGMMAVTQGEELHYDEL